MASSNSPLKTPLLISSSAEELLNCVQKSSFPLLIHFKWMTISLSVRIIINVLWMWTRIVAGLLKLSLGPTKPIGKSLWPTNPSRGWARARTLRDHRSMTKSQVGDVVDKLRVAMALLLSRAHLNNITILCIGTPPPGPTNWINNANRPHNSHPVDDKEDSTLSQIDGEWGKVSAAHWEEEELVHRMAHNYPFRDRRFVLRFNTLCLSLNGN